MLTFKEFIAEQANKQGLIAKKDCRKVAESSGLEAYISKHGKQREEERLIPEDELKNLAIKCLDYCKQKPAEVGKSFEVLFYSTKQKQAIIGSFRRDIAGNAADKTKYLFIVTVLPPTKHFAKPGTHKITLKESYQPGSEVIAMYESMDIEVPSHVIVID